MNPFEINVDKYFDSYNGNDLINCLLENGYELVLTPIKYQDDNETKYSLLIKIGDTDESFR